MRIHLQGRNVAETEQLMQELQQDLVDNGLSDVLKPSLVESEPEAEEVTRGVDSATILSVLLAAVSAGGALSLAMGEGGFLTKLATVLEKYVDRKVDVSIEGRDGQRFNLSGSAGEIRDIISEIRPVILETGANNAPTPSIPTAPTPSATLSPSQPPVVDSPTFTEGTNLNSDNNRPPYASMLYGDERVNKPVGLWAKLMAFFR